MNFEQLPTFYGKSMDDVYVSIILVLSVWEKDVSIFSQLAGFLLQSINWVAQGKKKKVSPFSS